MATASHKVHSLAQLREVVDVRSLRKAPPSVQAPRRPAQSPEEALLEPIRERFAHRQCAAFALACLRKHGARGWRGVLFKEQGQAVHAACRIDPVRYFDAYGVCTLQDLEARYGCSLRVVEASSANIEDALEAFPSQIAAASKALETLEDFLLKQGQAGPLLG